MPITVSYPGVYVEEIPSGVHTISGVATSITAFVGGAQRGPVNDPIPVFSFGDYQRTFGGLTSDVLPGTSVPLYSMAFAVNDFFLNGGGQAIIVRVVADAESIAAAAAARKAADAAPSAGAAGTGSGAGGAATPPVAAAAAATTLQPATTRQIPLSKIKTPPTTPADKTAPPPLLLTANSPGTWGNNLTATVDLNTRDPKNPSLFNLTVIETNPLTQKPVTSETFFNLSISPQDPTFFVSYLEQNSQLVVAAPLNPKDPAPIGPLTAGTYPSTEDPVDPKHPEVKKLLDDLLAQDGSPVSDLQIFDANLQANKQGIFALDKTDIFNLLVIPQYQSPMARKDVHALIENCAAYCKLRRAFLLVDPPDTWENANPSLALNAIRDDFGDFHSASDAPSYAAIFYPRLRKPNPVMGNQIQVFPASATIAGICARTDGQRGVWKAPAGIEATLAGTTGLTVVLNDGENGLFNPIGINCLRTFPIIGSIVWGSRTLDGADVQSSDYKYIPVRRFALFLEESLYRGTQWVVFEPNDEPLWSQIRLSIGSFMQTLFRQGAFQGASASQAYFVKCDNQTTTQTDINNGIVNIVVGFAPLKPAEFVVLQIQQMAGATQS